RCQRRGRGGQATGVPSAGAAARSEHDGVKGERRRDGSGRGRDQGGARADSRAGGEPRVSAFPIILSAPSGGGKTTIAKTLLGRRQDLGYSVSCTTRSPRPTEVPGRDYYFISRAEFLAKREEGAFAESAVVHGNLYGTLRSEVERVL